jgi:hypothetical protein
MSVVVAVVTTGCVGAIDRAEFETMINERGGGISGDMAERVLVEVASATDADDVDDLRVSSMTLGVAAASVSVRPPDFPTESDTWTLPLDRDLVGPNPNSDDDPEEAFSFPGSLVDAELIEGVVDDAVERSTIRSAWASGVILSADAPDTMIIRVSITNDRSDETFVYDAAGNLVGQS